MKLLRYCLATVLVGLFFLPAGAAASAPTPPHSLKLTSPQPYANAFAVMLQTRSFDSRNAPGLEQELAAAPLPASGIGYFLVQVRGPVQAADRAALTRVGCTVVDYVPNYTFVVRADRAAVERARQSARVTWVGRYRPGDRIAPRLAGSGTDTLMVLVFVPEDARALAPVLASEGCRILEVSSTDIHKVIKLVAPPGARERIAAHEAVAWVEPWEPGVLVNDQAQWVVQTDVYDTRTIWDKGIRGEGQIISTCDSGISTSHDMFRDPEVPITGFGDYPTHRKIIAYQPATSGVDFGDSGGLYYHGTHTAGTACGDDEPVGGTSPYDGMAPHCRNYFVDCGGSSNLVLPGDLNQVFIQPWTGNAAGKASVCSNSWGQPSSNGSYNAYALNVDQFMWAHKDFLVTFSNGNQQMGATIVSAPATAKDLLSVGACGDGGGANMWEGFSLPGPTNDGRIKPTVLAPGVLTSANGGSMSGYVSMPGTSMSCPCASSGLMLVRQYLTEGWYPLGEPDPQFGFKPSAALLKAMAVVSADNSLTGHTIPDPQVGWGRVDYDSVLFFKGEQRRLWLADNTDGLETGQEVSYPVAVASGNLPMRVTLCWTDVPGTTFGGGPQLRNDLNLTVVAPAGQEYKGNHYESGVSTTGGEYDSLNVEENARLDFPAVGTWLVKVTARNIVMGPQPYALVVTGGLKEPGPALAMVDYLVDDSTGIHPNGVIDPGETVTLFVNLRNDSLGDAASTVGTLSLAVANPHITITKAQSSYGTISWGTTGSGDGFTVKADESTPPGSTIEFHLAVTADGGYTNGYDFQTSVYAGVAEGQSEPSGSPLAVRVDGGAAEVRFSAPAGIPLELSVWDASGRRVATLFTGVGGTGTRRLVWNLTDTGGRRVADGTYFAVLTAGSAVHTAKFVLLDTH